jgi:hypothetical protein
MVRWIEGSSSLLPVQDREPISASPALKLWRTGRAKEADQSAKDSPEPADLNTAFAESVEAIDFDWPKSLAVERIRIGIAEIVAAIVACGGFVIIAAILAFAGFVVLVWLRPGDGGQSGKSALRSSARRQFAQRRFELRDMVASLDSSLQ